MDRNRVLLIGERSCSCCFSHTSLPLAASCLGNDRWKRLAQGIIMRGEEERIAESWSSQAAGWLHAA